MPLRFYPETAGGDNTLELYRLWSGLRVSRKAVDVRAGALPIRVVGRSRVGDWRGDCLGGLHVGDRHGFFWCSRHAQTGVEGGAAVVGKVAG